MRGISCLAEQPLALQKGRRLLHGVGYVVSELVTDTECFVGNETTTTSEML
jgi:hypothetical protein